LSGTQAGLPRSQGRGARRAQRTAPPRRRRSELVNTSPVDLTVLGPAFLGERDGVPRVASLVAGQAMPADDELPARISPADGRALFSGIDTGDAHVDPAVAAARAAVRGGAWGRTTGRDRAKVLSRAAMKIEERSEALARLLVAENG